MNHTTTLSPLPKRKPLRSECINEHCFDRAVVTVNTNLFSEISFFFLVQIKTNKRTQGHNNPRWTKRNEGVGEGDRQTVTKRQSRGQKRRSLFFITFPYLSQNPRLFQFPSLILCLFSRRVCRRQTRPTILQSLAVPMILHPVSLFYVVVVITSTITVADPGGDCSSVHLFLTLQLRSEFGCMNLLFYSASQKPRRQ
jgi:hypothetical protein